MFSLFQHEVIYSVFKLFCHYFLLAPYELQDIKTIYEDCVFLKMTVLNTDSEEANFCWMMT